MVGDGRINVALGKGADLLMPGMTCKVKLVAYFQKEALTIPPGFLKTDQFDDRKVYVYVLGKDGKPEKRFVTTGKRTDKAAEILKGLAEGDKLSTKGPVQ